MNARKAIVDLLRDSLEYRQFFKQCCETSAHRLRSQAWQFGDELLGWDYRYSREELEDALLAIARKVLPETPAAEWDVKLAATLTQKAYRYVANVFPREADYETLDEYTDAAHKAEVAGDLDAFEDALRTLLRAALEARTARGERHDRATHQRGDGQAAGGGWLPARDSSHRQALVEGAWDGASDVWRPRCGTFVP